MTKITLICCNSLHCNRISSQYLNHQSPEKRPQILLGTFQSHRTSVALPVPDTLALFPPLITFTFIFLYNLGPLISHSYTNANNFKHTRKPFLGNSSPNLFNSTFSASFGPWILVPKIFPWNSIRRRNFDPYNL